MLSALRDDADLVLPVPELFGSKHADSEFMPRRVQINLSTHQAIDAHVGDPMEDLAYLCMRWWRFGNDRLPVGGFGRIETLRGAFEQAGGTWNQASYEWWTIARTAWWGIGLAGQAAAFADGRSTSIVHAASGRRVAELEYDLLRLIGS